MFWNQVSIFKYIFLESVENEESDEETEDLTCLDCDQVLELHEGEK